jgi:hypothetical protein
MRRRLVKDWVLLEGRAREIARAEARLGLQQARKQGSINDYLQSLRQRGHVGLANIGLAVLSTDGTLGREPDKRRTPRPGERMDGLVGLGSAVCTPVMGGQRHNVEHGPAGV